MNWKIFRICVWLSALGLGIATGPAEASSDARTVTDTGVTVAQTGERRDRFTLVDHTGRRVTDRAFRGGFMLIYFGYTYCPDICPTSLQAIANALDILGEKAKQVRPIFISIDAKRDTPAHLADYVELFHPRLVGLTGTPKQVSDAAAAFGVHYKIAEFQGEYLVGHTSKTFLLGPDGRPIVAFPHGTDAEGLAAEIGPLIDAEGSTARK